MDWRFNQLSKHERCILVMTNMSDTWNLSKQNKALELLFAKAKIELANIN